ncbi:glycoside hydrolase family 16 protein [Rhizobium leucaenae]|uniref:Endo-1,3-1,4-beta-glycanase ExoK n=2 Tax=Rhizobium leucaenae TaxID=29450 RepID=A0A7W7ENE6_9HYPH|nr:glycoside hydrolase family 16 protein [Rhizobium leucaenae]MBB4571502.1 endo-1,3-1,4-beta-glycanase ExoK [Rhizobium leucaenae]
MLINAMIAFGSIVLAATAASAQDPQSGVSFRDDFTNIDPAFWYVSDGWNNGNHQNCTWSRNEVRIEGDSLALTFTKGKSKDRDYLCGEIQTTRRYGYGTYEARLKAASGSGLNSAFFTYIGPPTQQIHDEIDFEILGKNTDAVQLNQFVKAKGGNEYLVDIGDPADQNFNTYALVWEPERLRYFLNGRLVHDVTDASKVPASPQKIFFSLWGTDTLSDWMGKFSYSRPVTFDIDWVAFTAAGDKCQFPQSLVCTLQ